MPSQDSSSQASSCLKVLEERNNLRQQIFEYANVRQEDESDMSKNLLACLNEHYKPDLATKHMNAIVMAEKAFYFVKANVDSNHRLANIILKEQQKAIQRYRENEGEIELSKNCKEDCILAPPKKAAKSKERTQSADVCLVMTKDQYDELYVDLCQKLEIGMNLEESDLKNAKVNGEISARTVPARKMRAVLKSRKCSASLD